MIANDIALLIIASSISFLMAMGIGANDVSNAVGTAVGSRAVSIRQALLIATIFELLGAAFAGGAVSTTVADKLYLPAAFETHSASIILIMLSALLAAGTWLMVATYYAWPVSTTHTLLGALILLGTVTLGPHTMNWDKVSFIGFAWLASPILGGLLSYSLIKLIHFGISHQESRPRRFIAYLSLPFFMINMIWSLTTVNIVTSLLRIEVSTAWLLSIAIVVSFLCYSGFLFVFKNYRALLADKILNQTQLDLGFNFLMIVTACCLAYAHGSNDISNAIGPLIAINQMVYKIPLDQYIPWWILATGITGMLVGLLIWGHRVIETVGSNITELTSSKGFCASLATAFTVLLSSHFGYPISTTHTLVGAILGVGLARGVEALNLKMIRSILLSWAVTFPAGGCIAIVYYTILKYLIEPLLLAVTIG